jgi:uncharacterized small protein (DUF1192 family)
MARLTLAAAPRGAHRRTPEAWLALTEDLDGAAHTISEQDQQIAALQAQIAGLEAQLAGEREVRGHCDALIGQTVAQRDNAAGHAQHAYELLKQRNEALRRAQEVIEDLRAKANGQPPH